MNSGYIPKLSLTGSTEAPLRLNGFAKMQMPSTEVQGPGFQNTLGKLVNNISQVTSAPDGLMQQAMTTGSVDVHDVMIANAKAELVVNITAQMATKVIQAYDKILQIQI